MCQKKCSTKIQDTIPSPTNNFYSMTVNTEIMQYIQINEKEENIEHQNEEADRLLLFFKKPNS